MVVGWLLHRSHGCLFQSSGSSGYGFAFLILLLGGLAAVVLSYPIFITLERPVRITPEQAVRDFYGALSHHVPHLQADVAASEHGGPDLDGVRFVRGLQGLLERSAGQLAHGHAGAMTPLVFEVADFKADKSAGMVKIDAEFTLKIWVRGQRKAGVIHAIPMKIALVRGPDKMWYLENGTLGREA